MFPKLKIGRLVSGGIITNYFCTSACRHCLYNCSPRWEKHYISVEAAEENFRTVKSLGCSAVHIGGGEPMLRPEELGVVLDAARRAGVSIDYVETNSTSIFSAITFQGCAQVWVSTTMIWPSRSPMTNTLC